jgi:ketosteroid isomerase-like protein
MTQTSTQVATALFAAIESADLAAVDALYADDIEVWHNFSNAVQSKTENLNTLTGLTASVDTIHYDVRERLELDAERVLQRHDLHCTTRSGERITIPACMFITVRGGKIARIEEYLDSAQANALRAASGREPIGT